LKYPNKQTLQNLLFLRTYFSKTFDLMDSLAARTFFSKHRMVVASMSMFGRKFSARLNASAG